IARARVSDLSRDRKPGRFSAPPLLLRSGAGAARASRARGRRAQSLYLCDHDGEPWAVAGSGAPDRRGGAAGVRSDRNTTGCRVAALRRRFAPVGRDAEDPLIGIAAGASRWGAGVLRRPPSEPAAGVRTFWLRRVEQRLRGVARRRLAKPPARSARLSNPAAPRRCAASAKSLERHESAGIPRGPMRIWAIENANCSMAWS